MNTTQYKVKHVAWLNAEDMHNESQSWLSELRFTRDEHLFFEDLIKLFTIQLIEPDNYAFNKTIIDAINASQKRNHKLIEAVEIHENELQIMVDGINQIKKENAYKNEHRALIMAMNDFLIKYKTLKSQLFEIIKSIKKSEKLKHLLDKQ